MKAGAELAAGRGRASASSSRSTGRRCGRSSAACVGARPDLRELRALPVRRRVAATPTLTRRSRRFARARPADQGRRARARTAASPPRRTPRSRSPTGEFVAFLDHDDELAPARARRRSATAIDADPRRRRPLLRRGQDRRARRAASSPPFKPDWSPDLLLSCAYICHLIVVRRSARRGARRAAQPSSTAARTTT